MSNKKSLMSSYLHIYNGGVTLEVSADMSDDGDLNFTSLTMSSSSFGATTAEISYNEVTPEILRDLSVKFAKAAAHLEFISKTS